MPNMFDPLGRKRRSQLLRKYATLTPNGEPARCTANASTNPHPSRQEKVIFASEQKAVACAQALSSHVYESHPLYPYLCTEDTNDLHWHLTSRYKSNADRRRMRVQYTELQGKPHRKETSS
jgi:hypothetical protein